MMRSRTAVTIFATLMLAAASVGAQSFSEGFDDITLLEGQGWAFINNSPPGSTSWAPSAVEKGDRSGQEFQGNDSVFPAFSGAPTSYIADNFNACGPNSCTISDWLLTQEVCFRDGDTMSFYTRTVTASAYPDRLELRLSASGPSTDVGTLPDDVGVFTTVLASVNPNLDVGGYPETWTEITATIAGYPVTTCGRFAFRYYVTDGGPTGNNSNYIGVDEVVFTSSVPVELMLFSVE